MRLIRQDGPSLARCGTNKDLTKRRLLTSHFRFVVAAALLADVTRSAAMSFNLFCSPAVKS
jgi:hypothetical protein